MAVGGSIVYELIGDPTKLNSTMQQVGKSFSDTGNQAEVGGTNIGEKLLSGLKKIVTVAAIKKIVGDAISAGANLEQSIGGIETLYKDYAEVMIKYSNNAYKTSQMSANQYNEVVSRFSANLIRETSTVEEAGEMANLITQSISDNANKFGYDIDYISNVYTSLSKGMYQTLDNLSLGFAGTKTGAKELVEYASTLTSAMEETGLEVEKNDIGFTNMSKAIAVVQYEMGITGTTAKETSETYSGSLNSMKAAFDNFLAAVSLGTDSHIEMTEAINNLVEAVAVYGKNLFRYLGNMLSQLPSILSSVVAKLADAAPQFLSKGAELVNKISDGIKEQIPIMISDFLEGFDGLLDRLIPAFDSFFDAGVNLIKNIASGLIKSLPDLIAKVPLIVTKIADTISRNVKKLILAGGEIVLQLIVGIVKNIPVLIKNFGNIMQAVLSVINAINWLNVGHNIIELIANGVKTLFNNIPDIIKNIGETAKSFFQNINWKDAGGNVISGIINGIRAIASSLWSLAKEVASTALSRFKEVDWLQAGKNIINSIINGIKNVGANIGTVLLDFITSAFNKIKNFSFLDIGKNIIDGIKNGINNNSSSLTNALNNVVTNAKNTAKRTLQISSPSKVFRDDVGKWIPLGISAGIEDEENSVNNALNRLSKKMSFNPDMTFTKNLELDNDNSNIIALLESYLPQIAEQKQIVLDSGQLVGVMNRKLGLAYNGQI